jgi:hypothetical protein
MIFVDLPKILSAIFAGSSVLFAIYVYRRNSERHYFSELRKLLARYRQLVEEASTAFDAVGLVEVGHSVSTQLREICPRDYSTNEIQKFFYDDENGDFVRQGIYLGLGKSSTLERAKSLSLEMSRTAGEFGEPFPVFRICLGIMSAYTSAIVSTVSSGDLVDGIFRTVRENSDMFEPQPEHNLLHPDLVFRQMAIYVTVLHTDFINSHAEAMLEQIDVIAGVITRHYESMSDRQLRSLSRSEKKRVGHYLSKGNAVSDSGKALFEYLKFYKTILPHEEWDRIVESKTLLESAAPTGKYED